MSKHAELCMQHCAVWCSRMQYNAAGCNTVQHCETQWNTVEHSTTLCSTAYYAILREFCPVWPFIEKAQFATFLVMSSAGTQILTTLTDFVTKGIGFS